MLGFVRKLFASKPSPIGVDIGTDTLRLAQCAFDGKEWHLTGAACTDIPASMRQSGEQLNQYLVETTRELVAQGNFKGREAVLCVPSGDLTIQHVRMPRLDEPDTKKALPWECRGKLPIDASSAVLRHMVAGEVQVNNEPKNEVIVMATPRQTVSRLLQIAGKAKLEVVGMNVEPKAVLDCFGHVYRRKSDADVTSLYIELGCRSTRVLIARGQQMLFARSIPIGGDTFSNAVAQAMGISFEQAKLLRIKLASTPITRPAPQPVPEPMPQPVQEEPETPSESHSFALLGLAPQPERRHQADAIAIVAPTLPEDQQAQQQRVDQACAQPLAQLSDEINLCRRYCESTFAQHPVDRIIFVGGEARQRTMCQHIAQTLGLAAQLGDPLVRMGRTTGVGIESGIDPRQPQPAWAVALGLSMGPVTVEAIAKSA